MNQNSHYERKSPFSRLKEFFTLSVFTIVAALISITVMDLLILPISIFAINRKNSFNYIIREVSVFILILIFILLIIKKIIKMHREGFTAGEIARYITLRPLRAFLTFLLMILTSTIIIYLLYLLLNFNYYRIYLFTHS